MHRFDRPRRALAIAAAGLAGMVDAAGFLAADRYFVSFMSGNTTRFGVDLVEAPQRAWVPAALIAGFVLGVCGGALVAHAAGARRKPAVLGSVAVLLALAALAQAGGSVGAMMALLVLAMGALNNTFQRDGEVAVGLTYMTGALVKLGQGLAARLTGKAATGWSDWGLLWFGLAAGAALGAAGWLYLPALVLWGAALYAAFLTFTAMQLR
ncbi:DUF1275 family protein [Altererythrobacter sp. H2]|uniref:YoaK family protein n=1 Tax=Altererythrobacter sp. H2 TaxID=3108391 RepID=UPI000BDD399B|nr:DUF1275 family protein [Altererythrobacter sp. H2]OZA94621.1 MAG: DUF1275 family protein [Erythrobacter sp. 34-65-8]WRK96024.1 DUF1275 family protein [Altererythrobacter sp. H2]